MAATVMHKDVIMPKFGFTQETAEIVRWLHAAGDLVEQGDPIVEVTTDKVNMEVEAPAGGVLDGLRYQAGDVVPVTAVIAVIRPPEAEPERRGPPLTPTAQRVAADGGLDPRAIPGSGPGGRVMRRDVEARLAAAPPPNGKTNATPAARRIGQSLGVALQGLSGSGPAGRVQAADVRAAHARLQAAAPPPAPPVADHGGRPAADEPLPPDAAGAIPLTGIRRTIAERLQRSAQEAPHIYLEADIDVGRAEELRARVNATLGADAPRISLTAVIARVCAWALARNPRLNSRIEAGRILLLREVNIGVAVALDEGLIVPVVRDVAHKGLARIAAEITDMAARARAGRLRPDEVQGGSFAISNLGMFGVDRFTAIINPPTTAILAVGRARSTFVPDSAGGPVARPIVTVTLSADHRAIDGAVAGRFLRDLRDGIEQPELLLI